MLPGELAFHELCPENKFVTDLGKRFKASRGLCFFALQF